MPPTPSLPHIVVCRKKGKEKGVIAGLSLLLLSSLVQSPRYAAEGEEEKKEESHTRRGKFGALKKNGELGILNIESARIIWIFTANNFEEENMCFDGMNTFIHQAVHNFLFFLCFSALLCYGSAFLNLLLSPPEEEGVSQLRRRFFEALEERKKKDQHQCNDLLLLL